MADETRSDVQEAVGKRVVLTCLSNVSYAGVVRGIVPFEGRTGAMVRLHEPSGFSVWCPLEFVKSVLVVPIPD
jgi:hypothetical protein